MSEAARRGPAVPRVICREIMRADFDGIASLLTKGFAEWRDHAFWTCALRRLADRQAPGWLPHLGYLLEAEGAIKGVLLLIASETCEGGIPVRRCNVSSWYVEPPYRAYGSMLVMRAIRRRDVVYLNVTPAPETWALLAAQGYREFVRGRAVGVPLLGWRRSRAEVSLASPDLAPGPDLPEREVALLLDHARWDCLSLVCETEAGRLPFVFGRRRRRGLPFAYLLYCRGLDSLAAQARPLGRFLARRGIGLIVADANGRLPGMPGWFGAGFPKFYRGDVAPRVGDLAYTERAIFGV